MNKSYSSIDDLNEIEICLIVLHRMNDDLDNWNLIDKYETIKLLHKLIEKLRKSESCTHDPIMELPFMCKSSTILPGKVGWSYFENNLHEGWYCSKCKIKLSAKWEEMK